MKNQNAAIGLAGYTSATIDGSHASGNVSGGLQASVGVLVADSGGAITNSYAIGSVTGGDSTVGGLAGNTSA